MTTSFYEPPDAGPDDAPALVEPLVISGYDLDLTPLPDPYDLLAGELSRALLRVEALESLLARMIGRVEVVEQRQNIADRVTFQAGP
ncbi:MAG: hypothetical protein WCG26_06730 [Chloroflexales bacterium]